MIPVLAKPEPVGFDAAVRKPGVQWLKQKKINLARPIPARTALPPHWRKCLGDLHLAYDGVCAYLCVFIERCTGGSSVDHYIAKSRQAGLAYEWSNYRLACTTMNSRKCDYSAVFDPFELEPNTFWLELVTGRIYPNPSLRRPDRERAHQTIDRLQLDDATCREMRARRYDDYIAARGTTRNAAVEAQLKRYSPFIWSEAKRQGVL